MADDEVELQLESEDPKKDDAFASLLEKMQRQPKPIEVQSPKKLEEKPEIPEPEEDKSDSILGGLAAAAGGTAGGIFGGIFGGEEDFAESDAFEMLTDKKTQKFALNVRIVSEQFDELTKEEEAEEESGGIWGFIKKIGAILLLGGVAVALFKYVGLEKLTAAGKWVVEKFKDAFEYVKSGRILEDLKAFWVYLKEWWEKIEPKVVEFGKKIWGFFQGVGEYISVALTGDWEKLGELTKKHWENFKIWAGEAWEKVKEYFWESIDWIGKKLDDLLKWVFGGTSWNDIKETASGVFDWLGDKFESIKTFLFGDEDSEDPEKKKNIVEKITEIWDGWMVRWDKFREDWDKTYDKWMKRWKTIKTIANVVFTGLDIFVLTPLSMAFTIVETTASVIYDVFEGVGKIIWDIGKFFYDVGETIISRGWDIFKAFGKMIYEFIAIPLRVVGKFGTHLSNIFWGAIDIVGAFGGTWEEFFDTVKRVGWEVFGSFVDLAKELFLVPFRMVGAIGEFAMNVVGNILGGIYDIGASFLEMIGNILWDIGATIKNIFVDVFEGIWDFIKKIPGVGSLIKGAEWAGEKVGEATDWAEDKASSAYGWAGDKLGTAYDYWFGGNEKETPREKKREKAEVARTEETKKSNKELTEEIKKREENQSDFFQYLGETFNDVAGAVGELASGKGLLGDMIEVMKLQAQSVNAEARAMLATQSGTPAIRARFGTDQSIMALSHSYLAPALTNTIGSDTIRVQ